MTFLKRLFRKAIFATLRLRLRRKGPPSISFSGRTQRLLVSLTTIRSRLPETSVTLRTILEQTLPRYEVYLYISEEPYLLDEGIRRTDLPRELLRLEKNGRVRIRFTPNTGPFRKLLPLLRERFHEDCLIVTADDDTPYPSWWLEGLYQAHLANPSRVMATRGRVIKRQGGRLLPYLSWPLLGTRGTAELGAADIGPDAIFPIGKEGVLYRPSFFGEEVFDRSFLDLCPLSDDTWFKFMALDHGTGAEGTGRRVSAVSQLLEVAGFPGPSLFGLNGDPQSAHRNDVQIANVLTYLKERGRGLKGFQPTCPPMRFRAETGVGMGVNR